MDHVANPRPQTPVGQPVTKPETPLQNIRVRNVKTIQQGNNFYDISYEVTYT